MRPQPPGLWLESRVRILQENVKSRYSNLVIEVGGGERLTFPWPNNIKIVLVNIGKSRMLIVWVAYCRWYKGFDSRQHCISLWFINNL